MKTNLVLENDRELENYHKDALEQLGWNEENTDFVLSLYATANKPLFEASFDKIVKGEYKALSIYSVFVKESYGMLLNILRWSSCENIKDFTVYSCAYGMLTKTLNKLPNLDKHRSFIAAIQFVTNNHVYEYNPFSSEKQRIEFDPANLKFKYK